MIAPKPPRVRDPAPEALPLARRLVQLREQGALSLFFRLSPERARKPMVSWMDPGMLLDTGLKTLFSIMVGERSDPRIVQALAAGAPESYDFRAHHEDTEQGPRPLPDRPRRDLWIDYVCDTGDGWNSTYAIAYAAAQPRLTLDDGTSLPRGDLLVFGGDEVYPTPTREEYDRRLVRPYSDAFGDDEPAEAPHVFAIPGNHDWYDGLNAFSRLFSSGVGGRWFAGWWTRQRRSYFALRLPHRWWLLGLDGQLKGDIDTPQMEYFQRLAQEEMQPGDRVMVCLSQPVWIYAHKYRMIGSEYDGTDLVFLRDQVLGPRGVDVRL
ncbi:MAG: metallophosphoesterase, partial [Gemmatimonadales bacterium]|nr:metallophosphoesterase [Gemmatimonadales bacterium]